MRFSLRRLLAAFTLTLLPGLHGAVAQSSSDEDYDLLTGDTKLSCEALLCLSSGKRPEECDPALNRFFSIKKSKPSATLYARKDFLSLGPASQDSDDMKALVNALAKGAGQCDAVTLNSLLGHDEGTGGDAGSGRHIIGNDMPDYCTAYVTNPYTDLADTLPRYVGPPQEDGFWVEAKDYPAALAKYEREQQLKRDAQQNYTPNDNGGG